MISFCSIFTSKAQNLPEYKLTPIEQNLSTTNFNEPSGYLKKIVMYDEVTVYFIMPNNEILGYQSNNGFIKVGNTKRPPLGRESEFEVMAVIDGVRTYAIDRQGFVWQQVYPYKEIVGSIQTK